MEDDSALLRHWAQVAVYTGLCWICGGPAWAQDRTGVTCDCIEQHMRRRAQLQQADEPDDME